MDKEQMAIKRLQEASELSLHYYKQPLVITTSGGKDSDVCLQLAINAGIPFEVQHNHTTADAPETVRHVIDTFRRLEERGIKCTVNYPAYKGRRVSMWTLIPQKLMPPTRMVRYCCDILKEQSGKGRFISTGVRWDESASRKKNRSAYEYLARDKSKKKLLSDNDEKRMLFENCKLKAKRVVNPIIDWNDNDVWDYIDDQKICVNRLYGEGFHRVGCVGCPMAGTKRREAEFLRWPTFRRNYTFSHSTGWFRSGCAAVKWTDRGDLVRLASMFFVGGWSMMYFRDRWIYWRRWRMNREVVANCKRR